MIRKKLKADLVKYVDERSKNIQPLIDISSFDEKQRETWELARTDCLLKHSFVHLALEEGWTPDEAEIVVNSVLKSIPENDPEQYEKKLLGLLVYCEQGGIS